MVLLAKAGTSLSPYIAALIVGFAVGAYGHVIRSKLLIVAGILIVGFTAAYFAFVVGKLR